MSSRKPRGGSSAPAGEALPATPDTPEIIATRKKLAHLLAIGALRYAARQRPPDPDASDELDACVDDHRAAKGG